MVVYLSVSYCTGGMMASFTEKRLFPAVHAHMRAQCTTFSAAVIATVADVGPQVSVDS